MKRRAPNRTRITTFAMNVVLFLTLTVSSLAVAQAVPTIAGASEEGSKAPYRGTSVAYGHSLSVYNPTPETTTYVHRLGLMPEWHFNDAFHVRGRFYLTQEFTLSDSTNSRHEVELSDLWLDTVWGGWKEKTTGIKVAADLRLTLPTSKPSLAASRLFTLGPGVNVSRTFPVLSGLTLVYSVRGTWRFNRFSTRQNAGPRSTNADCGSGQANARLPEAGFEGLPQICSTNSGFPNIQGDVLHGPTVLFNPHERVNISASLFMQRGWVAGLSATDTLPAVPAYTRDFIGFSMGISYQPWDVVGFTLGAFTFANQLDTTGHYIFPLFNRNTAASIDATFDLEAIVSSVTKEKK